MSMKCRSSQDSRTHGLEAGRFWLACEKQEKHGQLFVNMPTIYHRIKLAVDVSHTDGWHAHTVVDYDPGTILLHAMLQKR